MESLPTLSQAEKSFLYLLITSPSRDVSFLPLDFCRHMYMYISECFVKLLTRNYCYSVVQTSHCMSVIVAGKINVLQLCFQRFFPVYIICYFNNMQLASKQLPFIYPKLLPNLLAIFSLNLKCQLGCQYTCTW